jgi:hypothetical protein
MMKPRPERLGHERLIDEMCLVLLDVPELNDDTACAIALSLAGYTAEQMRRHMLVARARAREVRATEADLWHRINADRAQDRLP